MVWRQRLRLVCFDGQRLRVVGVDVRFHSDTLRWSGIWSIDGETHNIALERPHPQAGSKSNPLCGDWEELPDSPPGAASTRLHVVQSSDGTLTAWMDRMIALIDQRQGNP
jgi:hypothetical protein